MIWFDWFDFNLMSVCSTSGNTFISICHRNRKVNRNSNNSSLQTCWAETHLKMLRRLSATRELKIVIDYSAQQQFSVFFFKYIFFYIFILYTTVCSCISWLFGTFGSCNTRTNYLVPESCHLLKYSKSNKDAIWLSLGTIFCKTD